MFSVVPWEYQTTSKTVLAKASEIDANTLIQVVIRIGLFVAVILSERNFRGFFLYFIFYNFLDFWNCYEKLNEMQKYSLFGKAF